MNTKNTFINGVLTAMAVIALASCTNDLKAPSHGGSANLTSPVATPDVVAWSGQQVLANTFSGGTRSNQEAPYWSTEDQTSYSPKPVTQEEVDAVVEYFRQHHGLDDAVNIDWSNYYAQQVYFSDETFYDGNNQPKSSRELVTQIDNNAGDNIMSGYDNFNRSRYIYNSSSEGFRFNTGCDKWSTNYKIVYVPGYGYYIGFDIEGKTEAEAGANKNQIILNSPDGWYYDRIVKLTPATSTGLPLYPGDEGFPAIDEEVAPPTEVKDVCSNCGHSITKLVGDQWVHTSSLREDCTEGDCAEGIGEQVCHDPQPLNGDNAAGDGGTTPNPNPGTGSDKYKTNHVEINFALNDVHTLPDGSNKYDIEDLVTKLSIHVRYPKDVEVVIPVPENIYCDQDDLIILNNHYAGNFVYGGDYMEYPVGVGNDVVTLAVEFVTAGNDLLTDSGQGYIRVSTTGINEDVINYCRENFGDGINFEVYNYYSMSTDASTNFGYAELQWKYLSRAFVNFDWQNPVGSEEKAYPDFYVNAFNSINGNYNPGDCYVWIMGDSRANNGQHTYRDNGSIYRGGVYSEGVAWGENSEKSKFFNASQGYHFNGSPYNWIYQLKRTGYNEPTSNVMPESNNWPFATPHLQQLGF
ncbi:MAG: hypothetical protein J1F43_07505 [Muribaculaceae bacterium]|nr:hypothetical protein [Muribaculaceae bacterium]